MGDSCELLYRLMRPIDILIAVRKFAEMMKFASGSNQPPKVISSSFEPHLGIFVDAQDKSVTYSTSVSLWYQTLF
jgi:hypothetical protein